MSAVLAFLQSLPQLLSLASEIISGVKAIAAFIQENKDEAWFKDSAETYKKLRASKSPQEKKDAADRIRRIIGGV